MEFRKQKVLFRGPVQSQHKSRTSARGWLPSIILVPHFSSWFSYSILGCKCSSWASLSVCAACDKHTEEHETYFESERTRKQAGLPVGEAHLPFAEMKNLRNAVLTGDENDSTGYNELVRYHNPNRHGNPAGPSRYQSDNPFR